MHPGVQHEGGRLGRRDAAIGSRADAAPEGRSGLAVQQAEELHSFIPGSRLVEVDSNNYILRANERAFDSLLHEVREFLATDGVSGR